MQWLYLVRQDVRVELEDGDDQPDGLDGHVKLLVEGHGHHAVLELGREQLQLALELLAGVERLQGLETLEADHADLRKR